MTLTFPIDGRGGITASGTAPGMGRMNRVRGSTAVLQRLSGLYIVSRPFSSFIPVTFPLSFLQSWMSAQLHTHVEDGHSSESVERKRRYPQRFSRQKVLHDSLRVWEGPMYDEGSRQVHLSTVNTFYMSGEFPRESQRYQVR